MNIKKPEVNSLQEQVFSQMQRKETEELIEIWQENDLDEWTQDAFKAVETILLERLGELPERKAPHRGKELTYDEMEWNRINKDRAYLLAENEFRVVTPVELKWIIISLVMIVIGIVIVPLIDLLPRHSLDSTISFLFVIMAPIGFILLIVFGLLALLNMKEIERFRSIKKIVISDQGVALYKKNEGLDLLIGWQQIEKIQFRYVKHMLLFLVEVGREPVGIEFNLSDGSKFLLPLDTILKERDRFRIVATISHYLSLINGIVLQAA